MTWQVAAVAVRLGVPPAALLDTPPDVWRAMVTLLNEQSQTMGKKNRRVRR